ncbi:MAG: FtsX-like permease family protein [Xanthomonadales bacterium]|nr:FtsX-like permease family protein [Xanthomonadales bacterium]
MELRPIFSTLLRNKTGAILIALQVALTLAIVSNALFIINQRLETAARPSGVDDESRVFQVGVGSLEESDDPIAQQRRDEDAIRAVPGVESVAWTNQVPLGQSGWGLSLFNSRDQEQPSSWTALYFSPGPLVDTLGLRIVEGRDLIESDIDEIDLETQRSFGRKALVTAALAKRLSPEESVVGKTVYIGSGEGATAVEVVGVVERLQTPWAQTDEDGYMATISAMRVKQRFSRFAIRAAAGETDRVQRDVEAALLAQGSGRLIVQNRSIAESRVNRYRSDKAMAGTLVTVTLLLLLVTASGIVGMASLWVNQRRKQIGVRRALGATRFDILRYFLTENLMITGVGVLIGSVLALALNQLLVSQMELPRLPLGYIGFGVMALWLLGVLAVYGPARRASLVPPAVATRAA